MVGSLREKKRSVGGYFDAQGVFARYRVHVTGFPFLKISEKIRLRKIFVFSSQCSRPRIARDIFFLSV